MEAAGAVLAGVLAWLGANVRRSRADMCAGDHLAVMESGRLLVICQRGNHGGRGGFMGPSRIVKY